MAGCGSWMTMMVPTGYTGAPHIVTVHWVQNLYFNHWPLDQQYYHS